MRVSLLPELSMWRPHMVTMDCLVTHGAGRVIMMSVCKVPPVTSSVAHVSCHLVTWEHAAYYLSEGQNKQLLITVRNIFFQGTGIGAGLNAFNLFYFIICIIDVEYNEYCAPHQTPGQWALRSLQPSWISSSSRSPAALSSLMNVKVSNYFFIMWQRKTLDCIIQINWLFRGKGIILSYLCRYLICTEEDDYQM